MVKVFLPQPYFTCFQSGNRRSFLLPGFSFLATIGQTTFLFLVLFINIDLNDLNGRLFRPTYDPSVFTSNLCFNHSKSSFSHVTIPCLHFSYIPCLYLVLILWVVLSFGFHLVSNWLGEEREREKRRRRRSSSSKRSCLRWTTNPNDKVPIMHQTFCQILNFGVFGNVMLFLVEVWKHVGWKTKQLS